MKCRRHTRIRYFQCPVCHAVLTATKHKGITGTGHIKTMYCYVCKRDRDFVQVDSDITRGG